MPYPGDPILIGLIAKRFPAAFGYGLWDMASVKTQVHNVKAQANEKCYAFGS